MSNAGERPPPITASIDEPMVLQVIPCFIGHLSGFGSDELARRFPPVAESAAEPAEAQLGRFATNAWIRGEATASRFLMTQQD